MSVPENSLWTGSRAEIIQTVTAEYSCGSSLQNMRTMRVPTAMSGDKEVYIGFPVRQLFDFLNEETGGDLSGERSVQEVPDIRQNRTQLYIDDIN